jgi:hypothetical protein
MRGGRADASVLGEATSLCQSPRQRWHPLPPCARELHSAPDACQERNAASAMSYRFSMRHSGQCCQGDCLVSVLEVGRSAPNGGNVPPAGPEAGFEVACARSPLSSGHLRRGGRAVECTGLENRRPLTGTVGSNPTPSAMILRETAHASSRWWRTTRPRWFQYAPRMKAILQATLAAALSGVLVGYLLKKKVRDLRAPAA